LKRECPVILVVLPSAKATPDLPWALANLHWVDFRDTNRDPLKQLIWGITGVKPREQPHVSQESPKNCVFISYRREDSAGWTGRLVSDLRREFPAHRVFQDIGSIEIGDDVVEAIRRSLDSCAVVLFIIGPRWLHARDEQGNLRLEDPEDLVRMEVEESLQRAGLRVVPVLVGGASMPKAASLPESIRLLARRNGHEITDRRWDYDISQLVAALNKIGLMEQRSSIRRSVF
jgi:hypothetical protein